MSSMLDREFLSINEAAGIVPGRPHVSTIWRWINRGVRGVKLKTWLIGGLRVTSKEALEQFFAMLNPDDKSLHGTSTIKRRELAIKAAERELDEDGI